MARARPPSSPLRLAPPSRESAGSPLPQLARAHAHETLIWASKGRGHTFNYDAVNSRDPAGQVGSVWRMPPPSRREKLHGRHPTQKPLRLVRRALIACTREGDLVLDPFAGSGTTAVAAKELNRSFGGAETDEEYARLAARRVAAAERGGVLREVSGRVLSV